MCCTSAISSTAELCGSGVLTFPLSGLDSGVSTTEYCLMPSSENICTASTSDKHSTFSPPLPVCKDFFVVEVCTRRTDQRGARNDEMAEESIPCHHTYMHRVECRLDLLDTAHHRKTSKASSKMRPTRQGSQHQEREKAFTQPHLRRVEQRCCMRGLRRIQPSIGGWM